MEYAKVDTPSSRPTATGGPQKGDVKPGRQQFERRQDHQILALTDALGNLVRFVLLPGQRFDTVGVPPLIEGLAFEALVAEGIRQQRH